MELLDDKFHGKRTDGINHILGSYFAEINRKGLSTHEKSLEKTIQELKPLYVKVMIEKNNIYAEQWNSAKNSAMQKHSLNIGELMQLINA